VYPFEKQKLGLAQAGMPAPARKLTTGFLPSAAARG
jgi:hypothetical protein